MSPFPGGRVSPGHFVPPAGGFVVDIDNSAVLGILSFGGFAFPIAPACTWPDLTIQRRDGSGDTEIDRTVTVSPAFQLVKVSGLAGVNFDSGGTGYATNPAPPPVSGFCSHGRWEAAAGVARVVQRTTQMEILDDTGTIVLETFVFNITANFTG